MNFIYENSLCACINSYQWIDILFWTWLTTFMRRRSPSLASMRGPGNNPFTVTMLFVWHNRVTFCNLIYKTIVIIVKSAKQKQKTVTNFSLGAKWCVHQMCSASLHLHPPRLQTKGEAMLQILEMENEQWPFFFPIALCLVSVSSKSIWWGLYK